MSKLTEVFSQLTNEQREELHNEVKKQFPFFPFKTDNEICEVYIRIAKELGLITSDDTEE